MRSISLLVAAAGVVVVGSSAIAQDLYFTLRANIDVSTAVAVGSADRIGTNVSGVAWNGNKLYIAGFNGGSTALNTGLMEVTSPLGTPGFSSRFGTQTGTIGGRGHSGLAINGNVLAVGYDSGSTNSTSNGYSAYDITGNTQTWNRNTLRGFTGPGFDPGFNAGGTAQGVAYGNTGSGRRGVMNVGTGADIIALGGGMIWNNGPTGASPAPGSNTRDMVFDPATGDIYGRAANAIVKGVRNGDNSLSNPNGTAIFVNYAGNQVNASNTNQQNLAFMGLGLSLGGNFLVFNDRPVTGTTDFATGVKVIDTNGVAKTAVFQTQSFNPFTATSGTGAFDFSYDAATRTLAVSDFSNSRVYIFDVVPTPGTAGVLGLGALVATRRRRK